MKMEPLNSGCLKIWMTHAEMERWGLSFDTMDIHDTATRYAICKLLKIARRRHDFATEDGLTVEVLPVDTGCLLLLTPSHLPLDSPTAQPTVYLIETSDDLLNLGYSLSHLSPTVLPSASLFATENRYHLILYSDGLATAPCERLISEFGERVAGGFAAAAYVEEHGRTLAIGDALQRLITVRGSLQPTPSDLPH